MQLYLLLQALRKAFRSRHNDERKTSSGAKSARKGIAPSPAAASAASAAVGLEAASGVVEGVANGEITVLGAPAQAVKKRKGKKGLSTLLEGGLEKVQQSGRTKERKLRGEERQGPAPRKKKKEEERWSA